MSEINNKIGIMKSIIKISYVRITLTTLHSIMNAVMVFISDIWLFKFIISSMIRYEFKNVFIALIIIAGVKFLIELLNSYYYCLYLPSSDNMIRCRFQKIILLHTSSVNLEAYDDQEFFNKMHRVVFDSNSRIIDIINIYGRFIYAVTMSCCIAVYIFRKEFILILLSCVPILVNLIIGNIRNKMNYNKNHEMTPSERQIGYFKRLVYLNKYAKEVRLTNILNIVNYNFQKSIIKCLEIIKKYSTKNILFDVILPIVNNLVMYLGIVLYVGYKLMIKKTLQIDTSIIMIQSVWQMNNSFMEISNTIINLHEQYVYLKNVQELLNYEPTINIVDESQIKADDLHNEIVLKDVKFKYSSSNNFILNGINMRIKKGEKIAIVGDNGSGKTTLVKLLLRLYDPTEGIIYYDDIDIKNISYSSYREQFGTLLQNFRIFATSIKNNIFIDEEADLNQLDEIYCNSGLKDIIKRFKNGLDTNLTKEFDDSGEILSGGEEQRIALARAYAKKSNIMILDEPSSALDPLAESRLFENIYNVCNDKTLILISHKLSAVINSDRILYMEGGRILEEGTHEELMKLNGKYAKLFHIQAKKYLEGIE